MCRYAVIFKFWENSNYELIWQNMQTYIRCGAHFFLQTRKIFRQCIAQCGNLSSLGNREELHSLHATHVTTS